MKYADDIELSRRTGPQTVPSCSLRLLFFRFLFLFSLEKDSVCPTVDMVRLRMKCQGGREKLQHNKTKPWTEQRQKSGSQVLYIKLEGTAEAVQSRVGQTIQLVGHDGFYNLAEEREEINGYLMEYEENTLFNVS